VVDLALGESSQLRYHSPVLQTAVNGLFAALAGWRSDFQRLAKRRYGHHVCRDRCDPSCASRRPGLRRRPPGRASVFHRQQNAEQRQKMSAEIGRMSAMIDSILAFARDDAKREPQSLIDLDALVEGVCEDASDTGGAVA